MDNDLIKTEQMYQIRERLNRLWQIPSRPDLFDKIEKGDWGMGNDDDTTLLIKFLSCHASGGISSKELDDMANEYQQDMFKQDEDYCEHCGDTLDKCTGYKCWIK